VAPVVDAPYPDYVCMLYGGGIFAMNDIEHDRMSIATLAILAWKPKPQDPILTQDPTLTLDAGWFHGSTTNPKMGQRGEADRRSRVLQWLFY